MWHKLVHIIDGFNWQQFHFLRPALLYLFIPLAVIVLLLIAGNRDSRKWRHIVQPALRPFLFSTSNVWAIALPLTLFITGASLCILSLAGPTWQKKDMPGEKIQAVILVMLDVSKSMLATDIPPNRLERAKLKLSDFLDANPRARAGLVAFAGSAHPVLPFTSDYTLIKHHAASLVNRIMPVQGSNTAALLQVADSMMRNIQAPSTLFILTDAITANDAVLLGNFIHGHHHHLEILLFSTPNGAKVPGYQKIVSVQDAAVIQNLLPDTAITITPLTLDQSDVTSIAKRISQKLVFEKTGVKDDKEWDDMGWLLLIPAVLITLSWFRRGWVIQWCWIGFVLCSMQSCGIDSKHPDWWYGSNYQGQLLENAGRYEEAAAHFDKDTYKAIAYFKAGNYEAAADLFAIDTSAASVYNRGLALAKLGRYTDALQLFDKAIQLDPSLEAMAAKSIHVTKAAKEKADSVLQYGQHSASAGAKKIADNKKKLGALKERKPQSEDEKLSSDTRVKKLPTSGNRVTDEVASTIHMGKEAKRPSQDSSIQKPSQSSEQVIMRQTVADPSEFLHRRFQLQVKRYYQNIPKSKEPW